MLEQAPQDHRVGDVGHVQLVEAEQRPLLRERLGHVRNGVSVAVEARRGDALVRIDHELVEVAAQLRIEIGARIEQVHEHRLAAPDGAVDIEPARRRGVGAAEACPESRAHCLPLAELPAQGVEALRDLELSLIRIELTGRDLRAQSLDRIFQHLSRPPPA